VIERLRRFAGSPAGRVAGGLLGLALLGLLVLHLVDLWSSHPVPLDQASVPLLVLAWFAALAAMTAYGLVWPAALRMAGGRSPGRLRMLAAFYAGQLGKYLPGGVFQYVGRAGLIIRDGVEKGPAAASLLLEALASAAAAAMLAPLAVGVRGVPVAVAAALVVVVASRLAAIARLVRRVPGLGAVDLRALPPLVGRYLVVWGVFGVAFWLMARALYDVPVAAILRYTGVFAAAWVVGFVIVFVPGGIGVREGVIALLLKGHLPEAEAAVLAIASRIAYTLVDLVAGVPALIVVRRRRDPML
jgi:uncharacterized membrane protein YbhN (UPF0104 family)